MFRWSPRSPSSPACPVCSCVPVTCSLRNLFRTWSGVCLDYWRGLISDSLLLNIRNNILNLFFLRWLRSWETKRFHFQAIQAGLFGPKHPSSRSSLLPGPVFSTFSPVWSCVFWRPPVWLLGPLTSPEEVLRCHEAGCVWRTCGDAEVTGGHPGAGNDVFYSLDE